MMRWLVCALLAGSAAAWGATVPEAIVIDIGEGEHIRLTRMSREQAHIVIDGRLK